MKDFDERMILDVHVGIVDECTWFCIAVCVDMEVIASSRDTALDVFAIIPEIDSPIYYYNDTLSNSIKMTACGPAGLSSEGFEMIKGCTGCRRCAVGLFSTSA